MLIVGSKYEKYIPDWADNKKEDTPIVVNLEFPPLDVVKRFYTSGLKKRYQEDGTTETTQDIDLDSPGLFIECVKSIENLSYKDEAGKVLEIFEVNACPNLM